MPAGRPKKYSKARWVTVCMDDKDFSYLDDHRGKMTRGDYLQAAMYSMKGETSETLKSLTEKTKQQSEEIHELKRQLLFEQSKNKKLAPIIEINEAELIKFYEEKNLSKSIKELGSGISWGNLFDKNVERLSKAGVKDAKILENRCMSHFRNNGRQEDNAQPLQISTNPPSQGVVS